MLEHNTVARDKKQKNDEHAADYRTPEKAPRGASTPTPLSKSVKTVARTKSMTRVVHHSSVRRHLGIGRMAADKKGTPSKLKLGVGVWSPMKEQLRLSQLCLVSTGTGDKAPKKTLFFLRGMVCVRACACVRACVCVC